MEFGDRELLDDAELEVVDHLQLQPSIAPGSTDAEQADGSVVGDDGPLHMTEAQDCRVDLPRSYGITTDCDAVEQRCLEVLVQHLDEVLGRLAGAT